MHSHDDHYCPAFRRRLRHARHAAGLTIYDLAELVGWRAATVSRAERGLLCVPLMAEQMLALALYPELSAPFKACLERAAKDGFLDVSDDSLSRGDRELLERLWAVRCLADGRACISVVRYYDTQPFHVWY